MNLVHAVPDPTLVVQNLDEQDANRQAGARSANDLGLIQALAA